MRPTPDEALAEINRLGFVTQENISSMYELIFAQWVKRQELEFLEVEEGRIKARLKQDPEQQFFSGAMCGQSLMSAIDTVMSLAVFTYPRASKGTTSQNNQFLRGAAGEDLIIEARILKMGSGEAYGETRVTFERSGKLVAHSTSTYAY
jgi:acyl-coenzyme A thioesterase PaaI-like protein